MNLTRQQITDIAKSIGLEYPEFAAFIAVESGGSGFVNGKIVIQFEPAYFKKISKQHITIPNGVEGQAKEWEAFNKAFSIDPNAAMQSTSIGLMQIMGIHYGACGYKTVGAMWDAFKASEYNQVLGGAMFIKYNKPLYAALKEHIWAKVAYYYNGANYKVNNYDKKLAAAYLNALK